MNSVCRPTRRFASTLRADRLQSAPRSERWCPEGRRVWAARRAEALLGPDPKQHTAVRAQAALTEGRILKSSSDVRAGIAAFDRALALYRISDNVPPRAMATALNNRGLLLSDDGQFDAAEKSLNESLALYRRALGDNHLCRHLQQRPAIMSNRLDKLWIRSKKLSVPVSVSGRLPGRLGG